MFCVRSEARAGAHSLHITALRAGARTPTQDAIKHHARFASVCKKNNSPANTAVMSRMTRSLLVLLAATALAAAAVMPLHRAPRALPNEGDSSAKPLCDPETPCGWSVYRPLSKRIELTFNNTYCDCAAGKLCIQTEDDMAVSAYVHRCRTEAEAKLINIDS